MRLLLWLGWAALVAVMASVVVCDCRARSRCDRLGGRVLYAQHGSGWSCVGP